MKKLITFIILGLLFLSNPSSLAMIALDSGDKIRGDASAATVVDYTLHGFVGTVATQLADGQLPATIGDLYTAGAAGIGVSSVVIINTDSSVRTVNLYITPSGGTARRLIPKDLSLGIGFSLHTDGKTITVTDASGGILTTTSVELTNVSVAGFTAGSILFIGASAVTEDNANFFWNDTDDRASIGINSGLDARVGLTVSGDVDILHTATEADDHTLELDVDAAGYGDVKAIDIDYITGAIATGQDEGVILLNIDETAATGGDIFGLEVLATDGSAGIYGMKVGVGIGVIHQDSGTFVNPTTGTDNTPSTDVPAMIDGSIGTTTAIFEADNEYIIIGAAAAFEELEFILTTSANASIKPTFWYSTTGSGQFTQFTPVDGTNGFRNTGVVAWDASDLTGHTTNDDTGTYDIKIIRTKNSLSTSPILGYAKSASTTEYIWDKDGNLIIKNFTMDGGTYDTTFTSGTPTASVTYTLPLDDGSSGQLLFTDGGATLSWVTDDDVPEAGDYINLTGGRSLTHSPTGTVVADAELYTDTKCINVDPDHSTTDWFMWRAPVAVTVTGVDCIVDAATSVVMTPYECDGNGGSCIAIEAAITCGITNTTEAAGVDNASIDAGDYIRVTRGTKTGSPTQVILCLEMTYDD